MERNSLHRFLSKYGITDKQLAAESGVSLRQIQYLKVGAFEPKRPTMAAIYVACRSLSGRKNLRVTDLFDFEDRRAA